MMSHMSKVMKEIFIIQMLIEYAELNIAELVKTRMRHDTCLTGDGHSTQDDVSLRTAAPAADRRQ